MKRLLWWLIFFTTFLYSASAPKILILHSYHQSFKWTDDITKGIEEVITQTYPNVEFFIEYMDTKRFVDKSYYQKLYAIYEQKYQDITFDLIISSDNNAFDFLKENRQKLFNETPVVFCGVNYLKASDIKGAKNFTGVNETVNILKNYELIKQLHPNVKNIYTIVDTTTTGKIIKKELETIIGRFKDEKIHYEIIDDYTYAALKEKIANTPKQSVYLLSLFFRSSDEKFFKYYDISRLVESYNVAPLYGFWDYTLENGIVGGYLTSGLFQGKEAALMALKLLKGDSIHEVPVLYKSPNRYMFDYKQLEKYNINLKLLPKNSYIINQPEMYYNKYKKEILAITISFIGLLILITLLLINIHKRKHAQLQINKQLRFQQTLIDTVDAPIFYKDKEGRYIGCNKAFEKSNGIRRESLIGKTVFELVPENLAKIYSKKDKELLELGGSCEYEGVHITDMGEVKTLIFYKNVFYDEYNHIDGIVGAIFDISQLKETTYKLNDLNKNLEKKVKERTVALEDSIDNLQNTQEQLVEAEKMASLAGLVAGVAHEINTPLGIALTGVTHLDMIAKSISQLYANEKMTQEEFEEFLKETKELSSLVTKNLTRAASLVKSFKNISVDQTSEEKRRFNVYEYFNDILLSMRSLTKKHKHKIELNIDKSLYLESYPGAFSQIFTNLIINSFIHGFKEKSEGTIYIEIFAKKNEIEIHYKDDGIGIKKENISKVFDPFFTTNRKEGGTGLGLNIIYNIITTLLNGSIECQSKENEGVLFILKLPMEENKIIS